MNAEEWLKEAEADLISAEAIAQKKVYSGGCFHCQQAVEKALKALLVYKKNDFPKTHSLTELAEKANVFEEIKNLIADVEQDYVTARYGDAARRPPLEIYDKVKFDKRYADAKKILELIRKWMQN